MNLENKKDNDVLVFNPLPKQEIFLYSVLDRPDIKFVWYVGGFGSGKTFVGSHTAVRLALRAPNGRGLIARNTLVDLKATTMKTFFEVLDPRLIKKWNKTENLLTLINGHEIYFWGLDDIEKLKSLEIGWFWVDEVNEVDVDKFNILKGRIRNKKQPKRCGFITSNSEGKNWTYKQFVQGKGIRKVEDHAKYLTIKAPSNENTYLPEDYLEVLNSYTGDLYERYVLASWNVFEGQIFPDFQREIHVIKPFAISETWVKVGGLDHGERNPTAFDWCAISPAGDLYFYREYALSGEGVDMHVKNLKEANNGDKLAYVVADPSIKSVRGTSGRKVDTEYREEWEKQFGEKMPLRFANNDVNAGIARMHKYLRIDPKRTHPITRKQGAPRIFIFDTCPILADEWENYKWKKIQPTNENDPEEVPRKKDDHNLDGARYIVMSRPDINQASAVKKYTTEREDRKKDPHGQLLEHYKKSFPQDKIFLD